MVATLEKEVSLGSTAKILMVGGAERTITINHGESDPDHGLISDQTPLAQAILGAHKGDERSYAVLDRRFTVKVLDIK